LPWLQHIRQDRRQNLGRLVGVAPLPALPLLQQVLPDPSQLGPVFSGGPQQAVGPERGGDVVAPAPYNLGLKCTVMLLPA
jgi:hypothetical protein